MHESLARSWCSGKPEPGDWLQTVSVPGNAVQEDGGGRGEGGWFSSSGQRHGFREHLQEAGTSQSAGADQGQVPEVASRQSEDHFSRNADSALPVWTSTASPKQRSLASMAVTLPTKFAQGTH